MIKSIVKQDRGYSFEALSAKRLFTNAKHKVKRNSFKAGIREDTIGYGLPNSDEISHFDELFNQEFFNFGIIIRLSGIWWKKVKARTRLGENGTLFNMPCRWPHEAEEQ